MTHTTISRRQFVKGAASVSAAGATAAIFGSSAANAAIGLPVTAGSGLKTNGTIDLAKYHCGLVHKAMSDKLTRIVADPAISAEETAHALKTTFCPCCKTQINASYPATPWNEIGKANG